VTLAIVLGTIVALASGAPRTARARRAAESKTASGATEVPRGVFFELGSVRATTRDPDGALVLATIAFSYDDSDAAFVEELGDKTARLREAAVAYFSSKSRDELSAAFEGVVKAELRERFDAMLSLGSVGEIWLPAFAVVD
jgi:flagellar basal body-associated protein FliL